jgi:GxxExxY protein
MRFDAQRSPESFAIIGAAIEVQRAFGTDLLESAYGDALELELQDRSISHQREVFLPIHYKGRRIRSTYRADFVCGALVVELKASRALSDADFAQMWHYLSVTGKEVGLLLNFGRSPMQIRRFVNGVMDAVSLDFADFAAGAEASNREPPPNPA